MDQQDSSAYALSPVFNLSFMPVLLLGEDAVRAYQTSSEDTLSFSGWRRFFYFHRKNELSSQLAARRLAVAFETAFLEAARVHRKRKCPLRPFWERLDRELNNVLRSCSLSSDPHYIATLALTHFRTFVENQPAQKCILSIDNYRILIGRKGYLSHQKLFAETLDSSGFFIVFSGLFSLVLMGVTC